MDRRGFLAAVAAAKVTATVSESVRRAAFPVLGAVARYTNENYGTDLYVESSTRQVEFVGRIDVSRAEFERFLIDDLGFEVNPVASRKYREEDDEREYEEGSFRLLPDPSDDYDPRKQLHVRIYDGDTTPDAETGYVFVYAHWEYRWDTDPKKHYRGIEWDADRGVRMTRRLLDAHGVDYDPTVDGSDDAGGDGDGDATGGSIA